MSYKTLRKITRKTRPQATLSSLRGATKEVGVASALRSVVNNFPFQLTSSGIKQTKNNKSSPISSAITRTRHHVSSGGGGSWGSVTMVTVRHPRCYSLVTIPIICPYFGLIRQSLMPRAPSCGLWEVTRAKGRGRAGRDGGGDGTFRTCPGFSTHSGT